MNTNIRKTGASGSVVLDFPTQALVLRFPLLDDLGTELLPRADALAEYIKKYPEAARAIEEMEQTAVIYLEAEEEEFHIQRVHGGLLISDHFAAHSCPAGGGLIISLSSDRCVISNVLHDSTAALERRLDVRIDLDSIYAAAYSNERHIEPDSKCGCFSCMRRFVGAEIKEFARETLGANTALCPFCGMDAVLVESALPAGVTCTDELLALMRSSFLGDE